MTSVAYIGPHTHMAADAAADAAATDAAVGATGYINCRALL